MLYTSNCLLCQGVAYEVLLVGVLIFYEDNVHYTIAFDTAHKCPNVRPIA